jgi:hypothetical protein
MASVCSDSNPGRAPPHSLEIQDLVGPTSRRRTRGTSPLAGATNANSCLGHAACLKLALLIRSGSASSGSSPRIASTKRSASSRLRNTSSESP